jgi:predicted nucleotidyltransferase
MDYGQPIEVVVPGVQGRVLGVLARTEAELTMRTVARLAGVSVNRAVTVLNGLIELGVVRRRDVGSAGLVSLDRENQVARLLLALQDVRRAVIDRLQGTASMIQPVPASLVVFGSFARGEAGADSDIDVLAVRAVGVDPDDVQWNDTLGQWSELASRIAGNPVRVVTAGADELPRLLRRPDSIWRTAASEGTVLAGASPVDVVAVA